MCRVLSYVCFLLLFLNCRETRDLVEKKSIRKFSSDSLNCPEKGECRINYFPNKSLEVKKDDLSKIYYSIVDNKEKSVIQFVFQKKTEEGLFDDGYSEEVVFEFNSTVDEINLSDEFLGKFKMLFGKHCYCKGEAGFYEVTEGVLKLKQDDVKIDVSFTVRISQVKHVLNSLSFTVIK